MSRMSQLLWSRSWMRDVLALINWKSSEQRVSASTGPSPKGRRVLDSYWQTPSYSLVSTKKRTSYSPIPLARTNFVYGQRSVIVRDKYRKATTSNQYETGCQELGTRRHSTRQDPKDNQFHRLRNFRLT